VSESVSQSVTESVLYLYYIKHTEHIQVFQWFSLFQILI